MLRSMQTGLKFHLWLCISLKGVNGWHTALKKALSWTILYKWNYIYFSLNGLAKSFFQRWFEHVWIGLDITSMITTPTSRFPCVSPPYFQGLLFFSLRHFYSSQMLTSSWPTHATTWLEASSYDQLKMPTMYFVKWPTCTLKKTDQRVLSLKLLLSIAVGKDRSPSTGLICKYWLGHLPSLASPTLCLLSRSYWTLHERLSVIRR